MSDESAARIDTFVGAHADELIALRRQIHTKPELSWHEHQTTALVAERLRVAGLAPVVHDSGTGLVCDVPGGDGPTVVVRADLDALPIEDAKDVPYRSTTPGAAHACGHDAHTACVLGAGLALAADAAAGGLPGNVRLVFQPAEEVTPSGAPVMIASGALEGAAAVFALHCDPKLDAGAVGLRTGAITSAVDALTIELSGPGGHTARPHLTADLVTVAAKVATELPAGLSRLTDARGGVNLTFGAIHAGDAANVIPSHAVLRGTLRAIWRDAWHNAPELVERLVGSIVAPYGASFAIDHRRGSPPVVNEAGATALAAKVATRLVGEENVHDAEQSLGGEDFAWYLEHVPGTFVRLGVRSPDDGATPLDLHTDTFDLDEQAIPLGAALLACTARDALDAYRH